MAKWVSLLSELGLSACCGTGAALAICADVAWVLLWLLVLLWHGAAEACRWTGSSLDWIVAGLGVLLVAVDWIVALDWIVVLCYCASVALDGAAVSLSEYDSEWVDVGRKRSTSTCLEYRTIRC